MNQEIIEAYIHDVTRRLPIKVREEVAKELEANIMDMLEDNPDINSVLKELGHPSELAKQYRDKPMWLISPDVFDEYVQSLKVIPIIALPIALVVAIITLLISWDVNYDFKMFMRLIGNTIGSAFQISIFVAIAITIIYVCIDHKLISKPNKEWSVDDLPKVKKYETKKIKRSETAVEMVFMIVFAAIGIVLLTLKENTIMEWFSHINISGVEKTVFLNAKYISGFLPLLCIGIVGSLLISVYKLIYDYYSNTLAIITGVYNLINCAIMYFFLIGKDVAIIDKAGIKTLANIFSTTVAEMQTYLSHLYTGTFVVIVIISIVEVLHIYYHSNKKKLASSTYW